MKITDYTLTWQESELDLWAPFEVLHVQVITGNGAVLSVLEFDPHEGSKRTRYNFFIALSGEELPRQMRHVGSDVNPNAAFPAIHVFMEFAR